MAICITFGTHEFTSMLEGYENVRAYCYNCMLHTLMLMVRIDLLLISRLLSRSKLEWPLHHPLAILHHLLHCKLPPLIPLATHKYKEVMCYTCRFSQDLRDRPDITPDTRPPPMPAYPLAPPGPHQPALAYGHQPAMAYGAQQPPTEGQKSQPAPPEQHAPVEYK
ncbi:hypothetical protein N7528_003643 [Penicillium herquei]|nr:hypothetical protein N7528_003643 [Penicillium herquei]